MSIDFNSFMKGKKKPKLYYPDGIKNANCDLWGYYQEESNYYNITAATSNPDEVINTGGKQATVIGTFFAEKPGDENSVNGLIGYYENDEIVWDTCKLPWHNVT